MKSRFVNIITILLLFNSPLNAQEDRLTPSYSEDS